jgi:hypothetical protein
MLSFTSLLICRLQVVLQIYATQLLNFKNYVLKKSKINQLQLHTAKWVSDTKKFLFADGSQLLSEDICEIQTNPQIHIIKSYVV